jgi:predicted AAA+ superfamily ATPase
VTGSSARKLRTKGINLLPGRIWQRLLHPLVSCELQKARIQDRVIRGSLPGILDSEHFKEELSQYVGLYLEEEIRAESVTRSVGNFSRFLTVAALTNGEQLNYSNISNDAEVKINTVRAYYQILKDTLIGHELESFKDTKSRKSVTIPKFYLFDTGVVNGILNRFEVLPGTEIYGKMFEHLVFLELKAFIDYRRSDYSLHYWRSHTKLEVDFLLNREIAIEVKSSGRVADKEENSMLALAEETPLKRRIIVCNEKARRKTERGTEIIPIEEFLDMLWGGEF